MAGTLLLCRDETQEPGLWFLFHCGPEGALAVDLTRAHPEIGYKAFEQSLSFEDSRPDSEKIVLLGGPERMDNGLLVLHDTASATPDSYRVNDNLSFLSYNYVRIDGKPPAILTDENRPGRITLKPRAAFLIVMGFRLWEGEALTQEIENGLWTTLPASSEIVFYTPRAQRRTKALTLIN